MSEETRNFQAEVSRLLDIVAHSVYSDKRVFLRELISNASDACDRLRYAALTQPELTADGAPFRITLEPSKGAGTLIIADNGIGMTHDELADNLGTIARSGTSQFLSGLTGDARKDVTLIGQFGIGFYSAFMVADRVEVVSRKAGEDHAWRWSSEGKGEFTLSPAERDGRGTTIILHVKDDAKDFLEPHTLGEVVKQYSDHIALPIVLLGGEKEETLNHAAALWVRPKSEITPDQYKELYHHVAHGFDDPWLTVHWKAEGRIEYSSLLFVPGMKPFDLYHPDRRHGVKLYVKRVFITDNCEGLLPNYMRFLRGVVDSEDLPLSLSREMLQKSPVLQLIRSGVVKRVLTELEKKAADAPEEFATFWENFGPVLKEGLYEEPEARDQLLSLARFRSTTAEGWVSLADYLGRMKEGQDAIFYLAGEGEGLKNSPHLEGFRKRGVEVLLLGDPVDEFWVGAVGRYKDKPLKSVTRGAADLSKIPLPEGEAAPEPAPATEEGGGTAGLVAFLKLSLADLVKDVRESERLTDSPVCLVADESDLDIHLERMLRQARQLDQAAKRILEINPGHPLIRGLVADLAKPGGQDRVKEIAELLVDQARIVEGDPLPDPAAFARRLSAALQRAL